MYELDDGYYEGEHLPGYWGVAGAGVLAMAADTGRFLVQLRSPYVNEPGTWNVVGGALDMDKYGDLEPEMDAAAREFVEETGYVGTLQLRELHVYEDPETGFTYTTFLGLVANEFRPATTWESSGWAWLRFSELLRISPKHYGLSDLLLDESVVATLRLASMRSRPR